MSGYRYPYGGDGHRPPAGHHYYEHLRHEPPTRPASSRPVERSSKPISGINMTSNHPSEAPMEHDMGEDERDDSRAHREIVEGHNAASHLRAAALPAPHEAHPAPSARAIVHSEDHPSLQVVSRRRSDWQYEAWLKAKSQYPVAAGLGRGRGRPPQMRASYPITGTAAPAHSKRMLGYAPKSRSVRDMDMLEQEMRHRIAASVLGDASASLGQLPFAKAPPDYRRNFPVRGAPNFDTEVPVRPNQPPIAGLNGVIYREASMSHHDDMDQKRPQDKLAQHHAMHTEDGMHDPLSTSEREKRPAAATAGFASHEKPSATEYGSRKRQKQQPPPSVSGNKETSMLDLLCEATLEFGPLKDYNQSTGCSCSKSHCIKLYCECFKARKHCNDVCACAQCKNTVAESGADGVLTKAIKATLARNPNAFSKEKTKTVEPSPGELVCRCVKSRCLKLYCDCFQGGQVCGPSCSCISCLNTIEESGAGRRRAMAIRQCLEKRPDAFEKKVKEVGSGCACKNNRCLKKYCDCFRFNLSCGDKCSCKDCGNIGTASAGRMGAAKAVQHPTGLEQV